MRFSIMTFVFISFLAAVRSGEPTAAEIEKLQRALQSKNVKALEEILKSNPTCANAILPSKYTALAQATLGNSTEIVALLLKNGAEVNSQASRGQFTAIRNTMGGSRLEIVKLLLEAGANPMLRDQNGNADFEYAMMGSNKQIVRAMLDTGKVLPNDPHPKSKATVVMQAAQYGAFAVLEDLVKRGGDPLAADAENTTVLHYACEGRVSPEQIQCVKFLVEQKKANLRAVNSLGHTPLHRAASMKTTGEIVEYLFGKDSQPLNAPDKYGNTPLMLACTYGNVDAALFLIKNGADMNVKNRKGRTCLELCKDETLAKLHAAGVKMK